MCIYKAGEGKCVCSCMVCSETDKIQKPLLFLGCTRAIRTVGMALNWKTADPH